MDSERRREIARRGGKARRKTAKLGGAPDAGASVAMPSLEGRSAGGHTPCPLTDPHRGSC